MNSKKLSEMGEILTAKDISEYLGVSYNYALRLIKYSIKHIKLGSTYRVTKKNFEEFLEKE